MLNLGGKIRELRKKKGLTQEQLADALKISPQAVSKWENSDSYPDTEMLPVIAGFFGISLDLLFGYDVSERKEKIKAIYKESNKYIYDDVRKSVEILEAGLKDYPNDENLLFGLLNIYAQFDFTEIDGTDRNNEALEIADRILEESSDYSTICWTKERQAGVYLKVGEYDRAKAIYESLPYCDDIPTRNETIAFMLSGRDKLDGATYFRNESIEKLYIACEKEGDAWFTMDQHPEVKFRDYKPEDYIPEAMKCYRKALEVLELFLHREYEGEHQYMWAGMQTFHYIFHQRIAACHKRLGQIAECEAEIEEAYRIVSTAWNDFEENREEIMKFFNRYLTEYDLAEYVR